MNNKSAMLKSNISLLGHLLGKTIKAAHGEALLDEIEKIRQLSKAASAGKTEERNQLIHVLQNLSDEKMLLVARAFSQFLNFVNIAEQHHDISTFGETHFSQSQVLEDLFARLKQQQCSEKQVNDAINELKIDLVLTAHPTEIARRTTIHKLAEMTQSLSELELSDLSQYEKAKIEQRLEQLIAQSWHSNEIRDQRPTPIDEAKWGFLVIENSLWDAVPEFLRQLSQSVEKNTGFALDIHAAPIQISSWVGGDRDGNPFVTAEVTREVLLLSRWRAADLYLKDINELTKELSVTQCNAELKDFVGDNIEPYRAVLRRLRHMLENTLSYLNAKLKHLPADDSNILQDVDQLWQPLY